MTDLNIIKSIKNNYIYPPLVGLDNIEATIREKGLTPSFDINTLEVMKMINPLNEVEEIHILKRTEEPGIYREIHNAFTVATNDADPKKAEENNCIMVEGCDPLVSYLDTGSIDLIEKQNGRITLDMIDSIIEYYRNQEYSQSTNINNDVKTY